MGIRSELGTSRGTCRYLGRTGYIRGWLGTSGGTVGIRGELGTSGETVDIRDELGTLVASELGTSGASMVACLI